MVDSTIETSAMDGGGARAELDSLSFERLPAMAMIVSSELVVARNALAGRMTGVAHEMQRVDQVLAGACEFTRETGRTRFDCMLVRRHGLPLQVHAVAEETVFEGERCHLLLLVERSDGFAGPADAEGSFLESVLDASPEATAIVHAGRVLHINGAFMSLFGYSVGECVGFDLEALIVPEGRLHEREMILHMLDVDGRASIETVRKTRTGTELEVSVLVAKVRLGGEANGFFVTYRDIRVQKQMEANLRHMARHDALTGLPNRALFLERVEQTLARLRRRPDRSFAVVFLDLDGFKAVNDTLGHAAGDALLLQVAERLRRCLRPQDAVARFGGDEFALLLDDSGGQAEVEGVAARIQSEIQKLVVLDAAGRETAARIAASMGIAMASTRYAAADELLQDADTAMYEAKAGGKGRQVMFQARAEPGVTRRC